MGNASSLEVNLSVLEVESEITCALMEVAIERVGALDVVEARRSSFWEEVRENTAFELEESTFFEVEKVSEKEMEIFFSVETEFGAALVVVLEKDCDVFWLEVELDSSSYDRFLAEATATFCPSASVEKVPLVSSWKGWGYESPNADVAFQLLHF